MNVNKVLTRKYEKKTLGGRGKNKANSKPNKANLLNAQMNVNKVLTKNYGNNSNWTLGENEPNQTQFQRQKMLLRLTIINRLWSQVSIDKAGIFL